jgi:lysophospholipase L1-like esterase
MRREIKPRTGRLLDASDLTVASPIKAGLVPSLDAVSYRTRAERVLRLLQLGRQGLHEFELTRVLADAVERVGLIHGVRVGIIEPQNLLMLSVTFDGDWEPYMRVVWQKVSRLLDLLFCHTEDYVFGWESSYEDWMRWLRSRQVTSPFLYSQPGLTFGDGELLRGQEWLTRQRAASEIDARGLHVPNADFVERQLASGDGIDTRYPGSVGYATPRGGNTVIVRQSVRSLAALHRLTDLFLPDTHEGWVLHRAAREALAMLAKLADGNSLPEQEQLDVRFADALAWFSRPEPDLPLARQRPPLQDKLADALPKKWWKDVQPGILSSLKADHGCVLLLRFADGAALAAFLKDLPLTHEAKPFNDDGISVNLALAVEGLRLAGFSDDELRDWPDAFYEGMAQRAGVLGDVRANHPRRWRLPARLKDGELSTQDTAPGAGGPPVELAEMHALLILRLRRGVDTNSTSARQRLVDALKKWTVPSQRLALQWLARLVGQDKNTTVEHFGWRDAQSDPVFDKANASDKAKDHGHVGEALCGHANAVDHQWPGAHAPCARWLHNGSFLVVRQLRQDVAALDKAVASVTPPLNPDIVRAKLMGRWHDRAKAGPAGAPLLAEPPPGSKTPNDFNFAADSAGEVCPLHAHIRRANQRQAAGDLGRETLDPFPQMAVRPPKLMRRSMSYGPSVEEGSSGAERGLLFMAYNASLAEQFEVLQRWLAGGNSSGGDSAQADALLGVAVPGRDRTSLFHHDGMLHRVVLEEAAWMNEEPRALVRLEWGAYWFVPALSVVAAISRRAAGVKRAAPLWNPLRGEAELQRLLALEERIGPAGALPAWKEALEDPDSLLDHRASSIWAAIREFHGGLLRCAFGVLVASPDGVHGVMHDSARYSASGYQDRMQNSFGVIFLGFDADDARYRSESAEIIDAIRQLPLEATYQRARALTHQKLDELWRLAQDAAEEANDLQWRLTFDVRELLDPVIGGLCADWFGVGVESYFEQGGLDPRGDATIKPRNPGHFASPSRYFFQPHPSADVARIGDAHGQALRRAMQRLLDAKDPVMQQAPLLQAVLKNPLSASDPGYAARTAVGVAMGFVPTVDGTLRRALGEWLREGLFWRLRGQALPLATFAEVSRSVVMAELVRAIQLRAAPELLWRTARVSHWLGSGEHAVPVKVGDRVVAGLMSATQSHWQLGRPDYHAVFGGDRDSAGAPTHACPGTKAGFAVMLGFFAALLECKLPLRPGPVNLSFEATGTRARTAPHRGGLELMSGALCERTTTDDGMARSWLRSTLAAHGARVTPVRMLTLGDSWLAPGFDNLASALSERAYTCAFDKNLARATYTMRAIANDAPSAVKLMPQVQMVIIDGGGNDVHKKSYSGGRFSNLDDMIEMQAGKVAVNPAGRDRFIHQDLRDEMQRLLGTLVGAASPKPIVIVAYDHPIPDGRSGWVGPRDGWLRPAFERLGLDMANPQDLADASTVMAELIDELNLMIKHLVDTKFRNKEIYPINLTGTLVPTQHTILWDDELHPSPDGDALLADRLIALLPAHLPKPK